MTGACMSCHPVPEYAERVASVSFECEIGDYEIRLFTEYGETILPRRLDWPGVVTIPVAPGLRVDMRRV